MRCLRRAAGRNQSCEFVEAAQTNIAAPQTAVPVNSTLREALRQWRLATAREKQISAFVILFNSALDELCAKQTFQS